MTKPVEQFDPQRPSAELLLLAYQNGLFPMADPHSGEIGWYCPDPRGIIPLDDFHIPKNLARAVRRQPFEITSDRAFESVMRACAEPRASDDETWIDDRLIAAYVDLHQRGCAHSIEAWRNGELVGGLYGVHLGAAFFGESMFSRTSNASKICLVHLVQWLRHRNFKLLDTQFWNEHLDQFGCVEIPQFDYLRALERATAKQTEWGDFQPLAD